jgi:hypothetical protein
MPRVKAQESTKVPPVIASGAVHTEDHQIGDDAPREVQVKDDAPVTLSAAFQQEIDRPVDQEQLAMLAFMAEPVTIRIAQSTDKNAEQVFELNINGRLELFRRGETKTIPRYFADRLARLKVTTYSQREVVNAEGVKGIVYDPFTALKYDFSMVRDDHPRGRDWLAAVLAEHG